MPSLGATFWEDLLEFIEERRVIPVIGAELLRVGEGESSMPLHAHVARRLAQRLGVDLDTPPNEGARPEPAEGALNRVVYHYLKTGGHREDIYPALRAVMKDDPVAIPTPLRQLAGIRDFALFVTTTFDSLLEQALKEQRGTAQAIVYSPASVEDLPCPLRKLKTPTVFHLLGRLSATPDYVITDEDTLEFLYAMQGDKRPQVLFDELKNNHLLLLGCSFPDWLARFFIRLAKGGRLSDRRDWREIVADRTTRQDANLVLFLEHFSYRTKVFAEGDAVQFVDELSRRWVARHADSPPSAAPPAASASREGEVEMPAGAIFLSYASQDLPAIERLHAGLTAAGVEAWLDKRSLEHGDLYDAKIRREIKHCSYFLPVVSATTQSRLEGYFRMEWRLAADRAMQFARTTPFILPVTVDATTQAGAEVPDAFLDAQWASLPGGEVTPEFAVRVVRLVRDHHKRQRGPA